MRKSMIVLLLIIQISLLFFFSNMSSLLDEVEKKEETKIAQKSKISLQSLNIIKTINKIFSYFVIILAFFILLTGGYFVYALSSKKRKVSAPEIPQLQNYLFQLKSSENQLKNLVETQQKKVLNSDELSRNIINSMDVAVILLNKGNKIEIFNKTAEKIFMKTMAIAKNNDFKLVLSEYKEIVEIIALNLNKQRAFFELSSNKKFFKIELIQMKEIGTLLLINDITEEKKKEIIVQKNRNFIMLGEMTAFLVHEVRNSLGVIFGYTRTIDKKIDKIEKVNKEIIFLTEMMERFLNFSKPLKEERKTEVNLNNMITNIAEKHKIYLSVSGDNFSLKTDSIQLETVFSNLIRNAVEASATKIEFEIKENDTVNIIIKDNGSGIKENDLDKIWLPFFTTKTKGTGMGLALVKKSMHYLNGDISINKSSSEGTEVKIDLY